jgi:hypothetical protein
VGKYTCFEALTVLGSQRFDTIEIAPNRYAARPRGHSRFRQFASQSPASIRR